MNEQTHYVTIKEGPLFNLLSKLNEEQRQDLLDGFEEDALSDKDCAKLEALLECIAQPYSQSQTQPAFAKVCEFCESGEILVVIDRPFH